MTKLVFKIKYQQGEIVNKEISSVVIYLYMFFTTDKEVYNFT